AFVKEAEGLFDTIAAILFTAHGLNEFQIDALWNDVLLVRFGKKQAYGLTSVFTVVEREFVDVHADEPVGLLQIQTAGKLNGIVDRFLAMVKAVLNASPNVAGHLLHEILSAAEL